jgi:GntR family transcriptional regulator
MQREVQRRDRRGLPIQVYERLRQRIVDGEFGPGSRLPSEPEMASLFGVSRLTIREALRMLQRDMLIESRHGRGHFVLRLPKLVRKPISELQSVTELMTGLGYPVENEVLEVRRETARDVAGPLQLDPEAGIVRLERLRTSDGEPMIYSVDIFAAELVGTEQPDWQGSLLALLESTGRARIGYSQASIRAATLPLPTRERVPLPPTLPWILLEQVAYTSEHRPVLYSQDYHRGDLFEFQVLRHRTSPRGRGR